MKNNQDKPKSSILLVTRPISPPWDEASKNFAYFLAKNVANIDFGILTAQNEIDLPSNVKKIQLYPSSRFDFKAKIKLLNFLKKADNKFSVFHFLFTPTRLNTFLVKIFTNLKKIKSIQTVATLREDLYSVKKIKKMLFADLIITYSDYSKKKLSEMGIKNVKRIYPGIDVDLYKKEDKNFSLMARMELRQGDFVLVYPGEYTRLGGLDNIISAFEKSLEKIKELKLILACRVKNKKDLIKKQQIMKRIAGTKLADKIIFTDTFKDMPKIYNLADVVLFPVKNMKGKFDIPLVIPEAWACEKSTIVSELPIFAEFVNEDNSVKIEKDNVKKLTQAIQELYQNPAQREKLGKAGRKFVEEHFDIKKTAQEYEKVYKDLI